MINDLKKRFLANYFLTERLYKVIHKEVLALSAFESFFFVEEVQADAHQEEIIRWLMKNQIVIACLSV